VNPTIGLGDGVRERLLAQHVLAGREGGEGDLGVRRAGRDDVDDVDVVPRDDLTPVGRGFGPPPLRGGRGGGVGSASDDDGHLDGRGEVEEAGGDAPPLRVGGSHEAVSDHRDAQCCHRSGVLQVRGSG
jgi:hypothetical protein